jgi:flagellum-specific peptidoglycan hydrolase FlgJ
MDEARAKRTKQLAVCAVEEERRTKVPALLSLVQAIIESKWLSAPAGHFNCLGIKKANRHTLSALVETHETLSDAALQRWKRPILSKTRLASGKWDILTSDEFADFPSLQDCFLDHAHIVSEVANYAKPWSAFVASGYTAIQGLFDGIIHIYGTGESYANLAKQISQQHDVLTILDEARKEVVA